MTENIGQAQEMIRGSVFRQIFNREFVLSVIIPITILVVFSHFNRTLLGTILAGSWALAATAIKYIRERRVNIYALIVAGFSGAGLIGTVISRNPTFYLAAPISLDLLLAAAFLGSLLFRKSLVQIFAEYEMKNRFSQALRMHPKYTKAWVILTVGWGVLSLSQALLRVVLLLSAPVAVFFTVSSLYGSISTPLFLIFTFWFPRWYWRNLSLTRNDELHGNPAVNGGPKGNANTERMPIFWV